MLDDGEQADQEAVDLYSFTSIIKRNLDEEARIRFIELMWDVVFADGSAHELEDNVVWRVAELIGVSTRDRVTMKQTGGGSRKANGARGIGPSECTKLAGWKAGSRSVPKS